MVMDAVCGSGSREADISYGEGRRTLKPSRVPYSIDARQTKKACFPPKLFCLSQHLDSLMLCAYIPSFKIPEIRVIDSELQIQ